ncbi:MAG: acetyl-CoA C-acyltransferase [bacterium JZ-2024 1]
MPEAFLVAGARTPFGKHLGSFMTVNSTELGVYAARGALQKAGVSPTEIQHSIFGNVITSNPQQIYTARHIALKVGVPQEVPALTINRLCGSGAEAIVQAAYLIRLGEADLVLAGGTENMSQIPHILWNGRVAQKYGDIVLKDYLWESLLDSIAGLQMAMTAEKLAEMYGITREMCDEYASLTQMRYKAAKERGVFQEEIVPVEVREGKQTRWVTEDEHPRPETTLEGLRSLKPYFKEGGTVTAGSASGIVDGAAAVVVASERAVRERGLKPLARIVCWGHAAVDPTIMGIGPAPSTRNALKKCGLTLDQLDVVEVNEAFVAQYLAVEKELGLDRNKTNVNGGATAVGHPLAATGTRLALTAALECRRRGGKYSAASMCIGGGQGITLILENVSL